MSTVTHLIALLQVVNRGHRTYKKIVQAILKSFLASYKFCNIEIYFSYVVTDIEGFRIVKCIIETVTHN